MLVNIYTLIPASKTAKMITKMTAMLVINKLYSNV